MRIVASNASILKTKYEVRQYIGDTKDDFIVTMVTPKRWIAVERVKRDLSNNVSSQVHRVDYESNPKASVFLIN